MCANLRIYPEWIADKDAIRFVEKIVLEPDGCWRWTGTRRHPLGYGGFSLRGRQEQAHRVSYRLFVDEIPAGLHLDHLCRVPSCVNPAHLEPVTVRVNTLRGVGTPAINAKKAECIHGHPFSGDNLAINNRGHRVCRVCARAAQDRNSQRRKKERQNLVLV